MSPGAPLAGLHAVVRGAGPDVVLVHGALGDYRQWDPISRVLSANHRVIAVSRRHHWPAAPPDADAQYSLELHAADLIDGLASLDRPAHVVGHSYGAGVALLAALERPEAIRSLTVIELPFGSLVPGSVPELGPELASRDALVATIRAHVRAGEHARAAEALIDWVQGAEGSLRRLPPAVREGLLANALTMGPMFAGPWAAVSRAQLARLRLPVFVLRGERTRPWYRIIAAAAASCLPGAQQAVVPDAGHMAIVENPQASAASIADFITGR